MPDGDLQRAMAVDWIEYARRGRSRKFDSRSPWWMVCPDCGKTYVGSRVEKENGGICPPCQWRADVVATTPKDAKQRVSLSRNDNKLATVRSLAQEECSNFSDQTCRGMVLCSDPEVYGVKGAIASPLPKCLVWLNLPCRYLERTVLPPHEGSQPAFDYKAKIVAWEARVSNWRKLSAKERKADPAMEVTVTHPFLGRLPAKMLREREDSERYCECGAPLASSRKRCDKCQQKQRRKLARARAKETPEVEVHV